MKEIVVIALTLLLIACAPTLVPESAVSAPPTSDENDAAAAFSRTFPNFAITSVRPSPIKGLYEVQSDRQVLYFAAAENILIFGELWSAAGRPLTRFSTATTPSSSSPLVPRLYRQSRALIGSQDAADVGTTIGTGPLHFVAYLQPDCGECRAAHRWLASLDLSATTEHVVFLRMARGSLPYVRALQVVCALPPQRRAALEQMFSERGDSALAACDTGDSILASQARFAEEHGIAGTPAFAVKGQLIYGFRRERLRSLLFPT